MCPYACALYPPTALLHNRNRPYILICAPKLAYVKILLGTQEQRTSVQRHTLYPEFYESFDFTVNRDHPRRRAQTLEFEVYDWDAGKKDDFLGYAATMHYPDLGKTLRELEERCPAGLLCCEREVASRSRRRHAQCLRALRSLAM